MAMRKIDMILSLVAVMISPFVAKGAGLVERTDTLYRIDTIIAKEVVTRTEVIHREEKLIRYYDHGEMVEKRINDKDTTITRYPARILEVNTDLEQSGRDYEVIYVDTLYKPGGKYVWIPDSMNTRINSVLSNGKFQPSVIARNEEEEVDLTEKVVFRGDTINMILKDRNLGRYDRGLFNFLFIPKGIWQVGLTASYGEFSTSDLGILDLVSDVDFKGKLWSIRPYFSYFLRSNLSVGLRLGYTHGIASIGSFNVDIDEDMSFSLHDIMYKSNDYSASLTFTQYLGIARKGRFGVFNEVELAFAGGNSDFHRPYNGEMRKTHSNVFQAALNFSPGVCVYVLDQVSFNVSLGVFGLNIKHEKQKVDGEDLGWRTTSGANFRFNIFNINFGIAVNI